MNLAQLNGTSQEYVAIITTHEILQAYMNYNGQYVTQLSQHQQMAENYVNAVRSFIKQTYPSINNADANAIILNGFNDIFTSKPLYWNTLLNKYNTNNVDIQLTSSNYKSVKSYGTRCL